MYIFGSHHFASFRLPLASLDFDSKKEINGIVDP